MPEHPERSSGRGWMLAQCQFSREIDAPQKNGVLMILVPLLWCSCVFGMNTNILVKVNNKQDGIGPDTVIVRPLKTEISFHN